MTETKQSVMFLYPYDMYSTIVYNHSEIDVASQFKQVWKGPT